MRSVEVLRADVRARAGAPEYDRPDLREVIFRAYRVVYLVEEEGTTILRVVHGGRDLAALVQSEPWDLR